MPSRLELRLRKWQLILLLFVFIYAFLVILNSNYIPIQWDEVNHFNGALLLIRGEIWQYATTNSFYPPLYNLVTAVYFALAGASVLSGRLVAVTFLLLSLFVIYKISKETYGEKTALLSIVLFAVMPGIVWLASLALIETMLIFVFSVSMLFFFRWLKNSQERDLTLSITALVLGVLVKYQILVVAPIIMFVSVFVFCKRGFLKIHTERFVHSKRIWIGVLLVVLAGLLLFELYASGLLNVWLYVLQIGNTGQIWYSNRFSTPIFYLLEMVWPYSDKHPISLLLYGLGLAGLALLAYRRKPQDNFLLVWFIAIYIIFTIIPNRQWRYVTPLFPVLAISASVIVASIIGRAQRAWQSTKSSLTKVRLAKFAGALLIIFVAAGVFYSSMDAITWAGQNQPQVPVQEAATYAMSKTQSNQSILVLCPHNLFSKDMVSFYLNCKSANKTPVYQYPELGVDAYTPEFNVTELVKFCQTNDTKMLCYTNTAEQYHTTTAPGLSKRSL